VIKVNRNTLLYYNNCNKVFQNIQASASFILQNYLGLE